MRALLFVACGLLAGFLLASGLDEERRRRLRKNLSELRELPYRVLI